MTVVTPGGFVAEDKCLQTNCLVTSVSLSVNFKMAPLICILVCLVHLSSQVQATGQDPSGIRLLALFSGTTNDLGLDHRLGRQVLKLASQKASKLNPHLGPIELLVHNDDTDCTNLNTLPNKVAEQFYNSSSTGGSLSCGSFDDQEEETCSPEQQQQQQQTIASTQTNNKKFTGNVNAILGPSCDYLVDLIARMAAYWRVPIYTVTSISGSFGRKDIYPTLTRLSPSIDHLSEFILRVLERFKWRHLAVVVDENQIENKILMENLDKTIDRYRYSFPVERRLLPFETKASSAVGTDKQCDLQSWELLEKIKKVARVVLLLINEHQSIRKLLLCAHQLRMNNGEYTFLALNLGLKSARAVSLVDTNATNATKRVAPVEGRSLGALQNIDWFVADDEENNLKAREMFESLMVFSVQLPISDEYNLFVEQTLDLAHQEYPEVRFDRSSVGPVAVALHDSLLLAVEAHKRHLSAARQLARRHASPNGALEGNQFTSDDELGYQKTIRPTTKVPLMWNERFSQGLITGMHVNSNGDQELDYILNDLEPEMGMMRPVASYAKETRQVLLLPDSYIHWPARVNQANGDRLNNDEAPPDEPECGFQGDAERCVDRQNMYAALTIVGLVLVLLSIVASVSLYRYKLIKYQMQLDDYWWKINWQDLQLLQPTGGGSLGGHSNAASILRHVRAGSMVSGLSGGSSVISRATTARRATSQNDQVNKSASRHLMTRRAAVPLIIAPGEGAEGNTKENDDDGQQIKSSQSVVSGKVTSLAGSICFKSDMSTVVRVSNLALYKGDLVIVKRLNGSSIEVSRNLLVELKSLRDLMQDNLARFVGLCLDSNHLAIVYEYCSRGSLQELLLNESVSMDWTLKYSIMGDILNGLNFIHTTLLDFHGRLKSTNLVLDSRFTVKLTDFGLKNLYNQLTFIESKPKGDQETDEDNENDDGDDDDDERYEQGDKCHDLSSQADMLADSRRLSTSHTIYNMDSVSVRAGKAHNLNPSESGRARDSRGASATKNRGAARFFWTAPEHLRAREPHLAGSKKGDVYALAVIFYELFTRKEPYHYGTSAKPRWDVIKAEKKLIEQQQQQQQQTANDHSTVVGSGSGGRAGGGASLVELSRRSAVSGAASSVGIPGQRKRSIIGKMSDRTKRRSQASVGPIDELASDKAQADESAASVVSSQVSDQQVHSASRSQVQTSEVQISVSAAHESNVGSSSTVSGGHADRPSVTSATYTSNKHTGSGKKTSPGIDAEEILDQLRMGVEPEPVRPYIPNHILADISPKMLELMRSCWLEAASERPTVTQVKNKLRKITDGATAKNYLDNLLDRLQTYAGQLERIVDSKSADIVREKMRTEELLYQLVPRFVADLLKRNEPIIPQVFDGVTIFFSDIVGFEKYASVMSPCELVDLLNNIYSSFDSIISSFDVTKIETILDQFLVASGISLEQQPLPDRTIGQQPDGQEADKPPAESAIKSKKKRLLAGLRQSQSTDAGGEPAQPPVGDEAAAATATGAARPQVDSAGEHYKRSSAEQIARMALCIRDLVKSFHFRQSLSRSSSAATPSSDERNSPGAKQRAEGAPTSAARGIVAATFNIRIGIHSGKVCAGIVGVKRPKFCLIGDTVNVASRMHTNSKANRIQISADTRDLLRQVPGFNLEPRGRIEVKGKGAMETFWLESSY